MNMIITRRLFERRPPSREAKIIYIFCEGAKRELAYFQYFKEMDSRINLEIYELDAHEDNSPLGLLQIAKNCILVTDDNPEPKYNLQNQDEVWIVLDSDPDQGNSRTPQISAIKSEIESHDRWSLVESNPCFEVWLYYHGQAEFADFEGMEACKSWKQKVNSLLAGGFDSRKHPIHIADATANAKANFLLDEGGNLKIGSTEIYRLSESMLRLLGDRIRDAKAKLDT